MATLGSAGAQEQALEGRSPSASGQESSRASRGAGSETPKTARRIFPAYGFPASTLLPNDPAYQPAFKKIYDERKANKGKDDPEKFCLPDGTVRVNALPYKIVQRSKMITLLWEGNTHSYRRIFLDGRKPPLDIEPDSWSGLSNGTWDGDTLVVDTVGFNDKTWLDATGKPHSDAMHVIQRYKRPDLGHLNVDLTIEDPKAFTKPYSFTRSFTLAPGWELQEYVCQAVLDGIY